MFLKTLLPLALCTTSLTAESSNALPPAVATALEQFCQSVAKDVMPSILTLDSNSNDSVPLKDLTKTLMSRGFAKIGTMENPHEEADQARHKRAMERNAKTDRMFIKALKTDNQGNLREEGLAKGLELAVSLRLAKSITLDSNKDGKLTLKEYAISIPITEGETVDSEGFSKSQLNTFNNADIDNNGFIEGSEFIQNRKWIREAVTTTMTATFIDRADTNKDGTLSKAELKSLVPNEEHLPNSVPMTESIHWLRMLEPEQIKHIHDTLLKKETHSQ